MKVPRKSFSVEEGQNHPRSVGHRFCELDFLGFFGMCFFMLMFLFVLGLCLGVRVLKKIRFLL